MKNKKLILAIFVILAIIVSNSFGFYYNKYSKIAIPQYYNNQDQIISKKDIKILVEEYKNLLLTNKLYEYVYNKYWLYELKNVANIIWKQYYLLSEILKQNNINFDNKIDEKKYKELKKMIDKSKEKAIEALIQLNIENIKNYLKKRKEIKNDFIKQILDVLYKFSYNQIRKLVKISYNLWYQLSSDIYNQIKVNNIYIDDYIQRKTWIKQFKQKYKYNFDLKKIKTKKEIDKKRIEKNKINNKKIEEKEIKEEEITPQPKPIIIEKNIEENIKENIKLEIKNKVKK